MQPSEGFFALEFDMIKEAVPGGNKGGSGDAQEMRGIVR
jgi:hypothetical protein